MRPYFTHSANGRSELQLEAAAPVEPSSISVATTATSAESADEVIDVAAVGKMLRIGRNTIYEMVARNEIPHRRFGRRIRFSRTAIMRWLDSWSPRIAKEGQ